MAEQFHEITRASRALLLQRRGVLLDDGTGEWRRIAHEAGLAYKTIVAISAGARRGHKGLKEMRLSKELALAKALGIEVYFKLPKTVRSRDGAKKTPRAQ